MIRTERAARFPEEVRMSEVESGCGRKRMQAREQEDVAEPMASPVLRLANSQPAEPLMGALQPIQPTLFRTERPHAAMYKVVDYKGPLFHGKAKLTDVLQNQLGDCDEQAVSAALAFARPDLLKKILSPVRGHPGLERVTFSMGDQVTVDSKFATQKKGVLLYGGVPGGLPGKSPIWNPVLEKATAVEKAKLDHVPVSYDSIGDGGTPASLFRLFAGGKTQVVDTMHVSADTLWTFISNAVDKHDPVTLTTYDSHDFNYSGTGVVDDHTNAVIGKKILDGQRLVRVYNQWGEYEPGYDFNGKKTGPNDGKDDGQFWIPIEKLKKEYQGVQVDHLKGMVMQIRLTKKKMA